MAEIFQVQGKDAVVKIGPYDAINAIQNFNWDPRFNEQYLSELGNDKYAAQTIQPDVGGSFELTATGSTVALLSSMITTELAGEFNGFLRGDPAGVTPNTGTIRVAQLENAVFDIIECKKTDETFDRATLIPRAHLSQISMRADANGNASETYSFEGDLVRITPTAKKDLVAVPCTRVAASSTDMSIMFSAWDDVATSGTTAAWLIAFAMIDEQIVPVANITVSAPGLFNFTGGVTASLGSRVMLYVYKRVPGAFPSIAYPTSARFVKGNQVDLWVVDPADVDVTALADGALMTQVFDDADKFLRAQSFDLNIDLRREALHQISKTSTGNSVYYRGATYPLNVTSSINVLETTMADHAKFQGLDETTDILDINSFEGHKWQIVARYYYNGTPIQTMAFADARVNGSGRRVSAGGRAEISWSFTGSNVIIEGVTI